MFGNPAAERATIEMTYEDTATISRTEPVTGANHITKAVPVVKYLKSFVRCRIQEATRASRLTHRTKSTMTPFCSLPLIFWSFLATAFP